MEVMEKTEVTSKNLENYFSKFKKNIVGDDLIFNGPFGPKRVIYADWIASGRLYGPIEEKLAKEIGPYVANTHTETSFTGKVMTLAYEKAKQVLKRHVNAGPEDVIIPTGTGMTGAIIKFQRILGIKVPEQVRGAVEAGMQERPIVFISHMEHHSNQTSWLETLTDVEMIKSNNEGLIDLDHLDELCKQYSDRKLKIASITACSNVTGIETNYHKIAEIMHKNAGLCFVDFACSAPYVSINMHPENELEALDAIFYSPHKFLGGPGSPGILIFNSKLYSNKVPDQPGGGTVSWTNPWGGHRYFDNIEVREDGGTPAFMQTIRAALSCQLKDEMGVENIHNREKELVDFLFKNLSDQENIIILADNIKARLGSISFYIKDCHYNLVVKLLNDHYGIQTRGGCSCAGTYGHYLLNVDPDYSKQITDLIDHGDLTKKPGWIRLSIHPTMSNSELEYICDSLKWIAHNHKELAKDYKYLPASNDFEHKSFTDEGKTLVNNWF